MVQVAGQYMITIHGDQHLHTNTQNYTPVDEVAEVLQQLVVTWHRLPGILMITIHGDQHLVTSAERTLYKTSLLMKLPRFFISSLQYDADCQALLHHHSSISIFPSSYCTLVRKQCTPVDEVAEVLQQLVATWRRLPDIT
jgi:hypothetical protein